MIKLSKRAKPQVLIDNEIEWTAEYARYLAGDPKVPSAAAMRYRHPEIKAALRQETADKCAYCESKVSHVYPGACEHILPKSVRPDLVVSWPNLTYVCEECNREKGTYHDDAVPVVNPYLDEPDEQLRFVGPLCFEVPGASRGLLTRQRLKLNRMPLVERRKERLERIQLMVASWAKMDTGSARDEYEAEIWREADASSEYSTMSRTFLHDYVGWNQVA